MIERRDRYGVNIGINAKGRERGAQRGGIEVTQDDMREPVAL
jgi:hypothetical protein